MFVSTVHDSLAALNRFAAGRPVWAPGTACPPTARICPSDICCIALQKMFAGTGTESNRPVAGSQTIALAPTSWPVDIRILPFGRSAECTDTIGSGVVPDEIVLDHIPDCAGFPGLELEKLTETGLAVPVLFAKSQAEALKEWLPFANAAVFKENV